LVLLGEAGRADAVVIYDLVRREKVDWFYCYKPQQVSNTWIVYVEYFPSHGTSEPTDVVLLYDLEKTPMENRTKHETTRIPPDKYESPVEVGMPIYPESNAVQLSYTNHVQDISEARHVLSTPNFLLLPSDRLIFVTSEGSEFTNSKNYLVAISLAEGPAKPKAMQLEIPKVDFKKPGENPSYVKINRLEEASPNQVRLYVPESEYGVGSILVEIPKF
jgi:hypothetical protein